MELPQTQGEEGDHGSSTRHKKFVGVILTSGLVLAATPEEFGPRNSGQFDVGAAEAFLIADSRAAQTAAIKKRVFIIE